MVKVKSILSAVLFLFASGSFAQTTTETEDVQARFNQAIQLYDSSKFEAARQIFDHIIIQDKTNISKKTISYIFESK
jgi:hypothetical protein